MMIRILISSVVVLSASGVLAQAPERVKNIPVEDVTWRLAGPGGGGCILGLTESRHSTNRVFVSCDVGGCYVSEDGGRNWRISNAGFGDLYALTVAEHPKDPNTFFAGLRGGLYRSRDAGRTWTELTNGLPAKSSGSYTLEVSAIRFAPDDPQTLYVTDGCRSHDRRGKGALYQSTDGGETWRNILPPGLLPPETTVFDVTVASDNARELLISTKAGLWRSEDGGATWSPSNDGLPAHRRTQRLARCRARPERVYVTLLQHPGDETWAAGCYRSDDRGRTWRAANDGLPQEPSPKDCAFMRVFNYTPVAVSENDPDLVYLGADNWRSSGVWKSTDGGAHWKHVLADNPEGWIGFWGPTACAMALSPLDPNIVSIGTAGHVFRTTDGGRTWSNRYSESLGGGRFRGHGLETTCLHSIDPDPLVTNKFYCGFYDVGLLVTEDNGRSFRRAMTGIPKEFDNGCFGVSVDPANPNCAIGAFGQWAATRCGCIAETTDGARTWRVLAETTGRSPKYLCRMGSGKDSAFAYCRNGGGLVLGTDGGRRWSPPGEEVLPGAERVNAVKADGEILYAGVVASEQEDGALWASADRGKTWRRLTDETLRVGEIRQIDAKGRRIVFSARGNVSKTRGYRWGGAWLSEDGGASWRQISRDPFVVAVRLFGDRVLIAPFDNPYHDHAGGGGVLSTRDGGKSWTSLNSPSLSNFLIECFAEDPFRPGVLWAGTCGNAIQILEDNRK